LARVNDPCTQEWYFVRWMMGLGTPLTGWKIGTKQWWSI
jgi:hypothetical protein